MNYLYIDFVNEIVMLKETEEELEALFDDCWEDPDNNISGFFIDPNDHVDPLKPYFECFQGDFRNLINGDDTILGG
ncbi:MAG: hypothetical protein GTN99_02775 [Candidatus Dadabacteria bacterium]|nr:hypothetical protein [Candidatus Dadabacteria bacterium]